MTTQVFINIPVKDLEKSKTFFASLGYSFNAQFTNEDAACMVISDTIYAMLLTEPFFKKFTDKDIVDAKKATEVIVCLSCENRVAVDDVVSKAVAAGAKVYKDPIDYGFMYSHSFEDLDGHQWEFVYMDPTNVQS